MVVNAKAIQQVSQDDIGRPVTYQHAGMDAPLRGFIAGLSYIDGKVFIKYPNQSRDMLDDFYNMRWGHVEGWIK